MFPCCMPKESGSWCSLVQCENDFCSRWVLKLSLCIYLATGTAICVCDTEPEDVNVRCDPGVLCCSIVCSLVEDCKVT